MKQNNPWVDFFLNDIKAAEIMLKEELYNHTCFFAHQSSEKALKGFLEENNIVIPKIHNLMALNEQCQKIKSSFCELRPKLKFLNQFYITTKYPDTFVGSLPGGMPDKATAEKALGYAKEITDFCLDAIRQKATEKEEKKKGHAENRQDKNKDIDWIKDIKRKIAENDNKPRPKMNEQDRGFDR